MIGGLRSPARVGGLYIHIPFCFHKCHYCDFYSIVDASDRQHAFVDRLISEMRAASEHVRGPLATVFAGGGTPTLLGPDAWRRLLEALHGCFALVDDVEFTVEANPETVTAELAATLAEGGVNRVSIGAQTFDRRHLATLERWHEPERVAAAVEHLRSAGIENLNLDLIFGIPGQSLADWQHDLEAVIALEPSHMSCYGLTYEPNTPLTVRKERGLITPADDALESEMYHATAEQLGEAGFVQYEISNWARVGRECRHNLLYWRNGDWWPLGPSASGHVDGLRWRNVARLGDYLESTNLPPVVDVERLDADGRIGEEFMLRLRLQEGIPLVRLAELLAAGTRAPDRAEAVERHLARGLLERTAEALRLTEAGRLLANDVLVDLL